MKTKIIFESRNENAEQKNINKDFENEVNIIFDYLNTTKIRELVNFINFECL